MLLKLQPQTVGFFPFAGGLVKSRFRSDPVRHGGQFFPLENAERLCPCLPEGHGIADAVIGKEPQHLSRFLQILIGFGSLLISPQPGGFFGVIANFTHVVDQAVSQVVMESLEAVMDIEPPIII